MDRSLTGETTVPDLVRRHAVRFEVYPDEEIGDGGQRVRVGFRIQLWGLHEHPEGVLPGCEACQSVYENLRTIAEATLPTDQRKSRYEIEPFDSALYSAPERRDRDEVLLEVRVLHRHETFAPIDPCEERCLGDIRRRLGELGVREGPRPR